MTTCDCLLCSFQNPKLTATAVIIQDQSLLVAKRKESPFKGQWDFIGGYINKNETPEAALKREIREELGTDSVSTYLASFSGTASYRKYEFPILSFAYLTQLIGKIKLNTNENSRLSWIPINKLNHIAFDSNQKILTFLKSKFVYDLDRIKELVTQLDPSAVVNEQSLYRAMLNGYISKIEKKGRLLGMGWIFPRQTLLRRQAVVEDMIVDQTERGKGYGEQILTDLLSWASAQGIEVVELTTNPKRLAANALYQKLGFKLHSTNHYLLHLK